jgi:protein-disulfide isomerase
MKRYLPFILIAAVAMLTVGFGAMLYRAKQRTAAVASATGTDGSAMTPQHLRGASRAPVTLEEFGDFQCPACATTAGMLRALEHVYDGRLRIVFWQFPLPTHQHGRDAALATEAASLQGRFWEMHDLLYEKQAIWSKEADIHPLFESYAQELHLNLQRFKKDFESEQVAGRVDRQREYGASRGVQNTPTLFINNQLVNPPFTPERLREAIDAALPGQKTS